MSKLDRWKFDAAVMFVAMCIPAFSGCSKPPFKYVPVSGTITLAGNPVPGVTVVFVPRGDGTSAITGELSSGLTDDNGRFTLKTPTGLKGAKVGPHQVSVIEDEPIPEPNQLLQTIRKPGRIPRRYEKEGALSFEVPERGTSQADFVLESK
ncbi:Ig-like domain-containing protein [Planctomicrobium sp. SH661]|uniref:Ig-like domain-containing protein n=1 Tax=Planctomicrobium sp. SH661 TaxID=3448124 RepID=UPI003F5B94B2